MRAPLARLTEGGFSIGIEAPLDNDWTPAGDHARRLAAWRAVASNKPYATFIHLDLADDPAAPLQRWRFGAHAGRNGLIADRVAGDRRRSCEPAFPPQPAPARRHPVRAGRIRPAALSPFTIRPHCQVKKLTTIGRASSHPGQSQSASDPLMKKVATLR